MYKKNYSGPMLREMPVWDRPREKIISGGAGGLSNAELVAVLLSSGSRTESAVSLAARVLSLGQGSLKELAGMAPEEFMTLPGIGTAKACVLVAAMELGRRIADCPAEEHISLSSPDKAARLFMENLRHLKQEIFAVAMLNVKNELIMKKEISVGGLTSAASHPREVFSEAVRKGAGAMILFHNHPSGDPTPSPSDITTTMQLVESGRILGIRVLDHIVIGDGIYISMNEEGLVDFN